MESVILYFHFILLVIILSQSKCEPYDNSKIAIIEVPMQENKNSKEINQESVDNGLSDVKKDIKVSPSTPIDSTVTSERHYPKNDCKKPESFLPLMPFETHDAVDIPSENNFEKENEHPYVYPGLLNFLWPNGISMDHLRASDFDRNIFNVYHDSDLSEIMPNIYSPRKERSDEDNDILEQLEHDAIIPNILPTMDYPFFRDAALYTKPELNPSALQTPELAPYFSNPLVSPLVVRMQCVPKITRMYEQNLKLPLPYYNYRDSYEQDFGGVVQK